MKHILASAFVLASGLYARDADAACKKWVNQLSACDGLVDPAVCNTTSVWSPGQWLSYKNWIYTGTSPGLGAEKACWKYVYKKDHVHAGTQKLNWIDSTYAICYWDSDGDGDAEDDYTATATPIQLQGITPETCCSRVANGRYAPDIGSVSTKAGYDFTPEQRQDILDLNRGTGPFVRSDSWRAGVTDGGAGTFGILAVSNATYYYPDDAHPDDTGGIVMRPPQAGDAQIDHIIPRIDENGCACGENTFANAAVISGNLNASMGRSCRDPRRQAFIDEWTLPAATPRTVPEDETADDEPVAEQVGGCSSTHGAGGLVLLALLGVGRRRRRG